MSSPRARRSARRPSGPKRSATWSARDARQPAEGAEAEPPQGPDQRPRLRLVRAEPGGKRRDRQRGQEPAERAAGDDRLAAGGEEGGEAIGGDRDPDPRPRRLPGRRDHPLEGAAVDPEQPVDLEEGLAGALGLDRGADSLEPLQQPVPALGDADRVGRDQPQRGAAGERLGEGHPGLDAVGLGGGGDLTHHLPPAREGSERDRLVEPSAGVGDPEREAGDEDGGDHYTNVCSYANQRSQGPSHPASGCNAVPENCRKCLIPKRVWVGKVAADAE